MVDPTQQSGQVINPPQPSDPIPPTDIPPTPKPTPDPLPNPQPTPVPQEASLQTSSPASSALGVTSGTGASSNKTLYLSGAVMAILLIGMVVYILLPHKKAVTVSNQQINAVTQTPLAKGTPVSPTIQPTIGITPVTAGNADQQLNDTANSIGQSLTQVNTDLNSLNSIDTTQDSANNL